MKLTKTASGKKRLKISRTEWEGIGKQAGWMKEADQEFRPFNGSWNNDYPGTFQTPSWQEERRERGACPSCEVVVVNGVKTHEHGCPDAWMDVTRECKWCGSDFKPSEKDQILCSDDCASSYHN
jgi:hypothetical protein